MVNWWVCKVLVNNRFTIPFGRGDVLFAKNGERVTLFDGKTEVLIPKRAMKNIRLMSRLGREETAVIDRNYQEMKAAESCPPPNKKDETNQLPG